MAHPFIKYLFPMIMLLGLLTASAACSRAAGETPTARPPAVTRPPGAGLPTLVSPPANQSGDLDGVRAQVTHVYDGDSIEIELEGQTYRLRYIGVDSPEREEPFYEEAFEFNRDMVEDQTVILVRDVSETDQYGRLLRYVYLADGTFVNGEMISNGMARLVTFPPDVAQTEHLRGLQEQAREAAAGMWSRTDLTGPCDCDRNLYDCRDFLSRDEAQACFAYCLDTMGRDVHNLDGGGDGLVCEFLP